MKELKIERDAQWKVWSEIGEKIRLLQKLKKTVCKHPKSKQRIRTNSYFEEGRMTGPHYWEEKVCGVCGEVVAHLTETITKKWSDE